ncbi:hypothetical protein [Methanosarcina sp. UBA411]|uniref:hypothetical protein n=1 Tax=Methanosarcina sp. UBA411 TaxID=1915589 RepID=UPI0025CBBDCC|nr:hypothetical protein [Methanosarcina sp. UBA411]
MADKILQFSIPKKSLRIVNHAEKGGIILVVVQKSGHLFYPADVLTFLNVSKSLKIYLNPVIFASLADVLYLIPLHWPSVNEFYAQLRIPRIAIFLT